MTAARATAIITLLEKAAVDNGFDQELPHAAPWLGFESSHAPLRVWLAAAGGDDRTHRGRRPTRCIGCYAGPSSSHGPC